MKCALCTNYHARTLGDICKLKTVTKAFTQEKISGFNIIEEILSVKDEVNASLCYRLLCKIAGNENDSLRQIWPKDLECEINPEVWKRILNNGQIITEAKSRGTLFNVRDTVYYTPSKLYRMGLNKNDKCWRCGTVRGTFLYALWDCPVIQPLWEEALLERGLQPSLPRSPRLTLLCDQSLVSGLNKLKFKMLCTGLVSIIRLVLKKLEGQRDPISKGMDRRIY